MTAARPDPSLGIFETLLVVDGRPVELEAHLARLSASARQLFGDAAEARTRGPARALARSRAADCRAALGRLRLTLAPDGRGGLDLAAVAAEVDPAIVFPAPGDGPTLAPLTIPGGLGAHKWADRRALDAAAAEAAAGAACPGRVVPAILDEDGTVLETERANVFVVADAASGAGTLLTPPTDGRILPGLARARVIGIARELGVEVREAPLSLDRLLDADEAFLTGSVRGIEPLGAAARTSVTARLASALRSRWLAGAE